MAWEHLVRGRYVTEARVGTLEHTDHGAVSEETGEEAARSVEFAAADLLSDEGWDEAAAGADYVLHTASPMPFNPRVDLITTAREGTRRVLGAAAFRRCA